MPNIAAEESLTEPLGPELREQAASLIEHLNGNHADTVLFLARHVTAVPDLPDAELSSIDRTGLVLDVTDHSGPGSFRLEFDAPVSSLADVQAQLFGRLAAARAADPDGALTSIERAQAQLGAIPTRAVTVTAVADAGPGLRQITFGGLHDHVPLGPDDFFLVIVPREGLLHQLDGELSFAAFRDLPQDEAPAWAYYTVRRWRPERGEVDMWFVLHEHDGAVSAWARRAQPGDRVALWGPRQAYEPPPGTRSILLVGDETGLGAFAAILDDDGRTQPVTAIVESPDGRAVVDLPARPGDTVRWVDRAGPGSEGGGALLGAVAALRLDVEGLYAYGAGESRRVTAVRTLLRRVVGLPAHRVQMVGYWRRSA